MLLINASDNSIEARYSLKAPFVHEGVEAHIPAQGFIFEPWAEGDEAYEVPDDAGHHFLKHFGPVGLMRYKAGEDIAALRGRGRREWYRTLNAASNAFDQSNNDRLARGLPPLVPGEHVVEVIETRDRLGEELALSRTAAKGRPGQPKSIKDPEFKHRAAQQREARAEAEVAGQEA